MVSIIIQADDRIEITLQCLQSIVDNIRLNTKVEVIVIYPNLKDKIPKQLTQISGLRLLDSIPKLGSKFDGLNQGSKIAKGEYLYFLGNNINLQFFSLESLLEIITNNSQVAAVGSKIVYSNGKLKQAGGIVWSDGSFSDYGQEDFSHNSEYNYLRVVDYCSISSFLIRKSSFDILQGFDRDFNPFYYHDIDLCFKIRHNLDLSVIYQPKSEVIYTGKSKEESNTVIQRYKFINQAKFQRKWQSVLNQYCDRQQENNLLLGIKRNIGNETILVIDSYDYWEDRLLDLRSILSVLKILRQLNYHIIFASDCNIKEKTHLDRIQDLEIEVLYSSNNEDLKEQIKKRCPIVNYVWVCRSQINEEYQTLFDRYPQVKIISEDLWSNIGDSVGVCVAGSNLQTFIEYTLESVKKGLSQFITQSTTKVK